MVVHEAASDESALDALRRGWRHHQEGDLTMAEQTYIHVLQEQPRNAHALDLLGRLAFEQGRAQVAVTLMRQAAASQPTVAAFHHNLGLVFVSLDQLDEAAVCFRRAVYLKPDYADAFNNLGNVLASRGDADEAIACYRHAISLRPEAGDFCHNLGTTLADQGDHLEAMAYFAAAEAAPAVKELSSLDEALIRL
jgi:protein O-GlcNAc transferase